MSEYIRPRLKQYIRERPDLGPLFGAISDSDADALHEELLEIDRLLAELALDASKIVGVAFEYDLSRVALFVRGHDAEISGGPTAASADLWFELRFLEDEDGYPVAPPPWVVTAEALVQCDTDCGQSPHPVIALSDLADTPRSALQAMNHLVGAMRTRLAATPAEELRLVTHHKS